MPEQWCDTTTIYNNADSMQDPGHHRGRVLPNFSCPPIPPFPILILSGFAFQRLVENLIRAYGLETLVVGMVADALQPCILVGDETTVAGVHIHWPTIGIQAFEMACSILIGVLIVWISGRELVELVLRRPR